jgi:hypothetical protein
MSRRSQRECLQGQVRQIVQAGEDATEDELIAELRRIAASGRAKTSQPG